MRLITSIAEMQLFGREVRARGKSLCLVPTMGALHEGHLSLVRQGKRQCDAIVVSIFVNPTQFESPDDLARYPRKLEKDLELLRPFKVDAVFAPEAKELYPEGFSVYVDPGARGRGLGRALLLELCAVSERHGLYKLTSRIFTDNHASRAAHRAAGFEEVGIQRRHGKLDGQWKDCVLVERLLGPAAR